VGGGTVPFGWTKTTHDLSLDRSWSADELRWAHDYERSLLREWARFPKAGDVYLALRDIRVKYITHWRQPYSGSGTGILRTGSRVRVDVFEFNTEPVSVNAEPLDRTLVERQLVDPRERAARGYNGFSLSIRTEELNRVFVLVAEP
jgi:hypothetical protein